MDPLRLGPGAADKSLGAAAGFEDREEGQGVGSELVLPHGQGMQGMLRAPKGKGYSLYQCIPHGWGKLRVSMGCSSHPGERDGQVPRGRRVLRAPMGEGNLGYLGHPHVQNAWPSQS